MKLLRYFSLQSEVQKNIFKKILIDHKLPLRSPKEFNDPYEAKMPVNTTYGDLRRMTAAGVLQPALATRFSGAARFFEKNIESQGKGDSEIVENAHVKKQLLKATREQSLERAKMVCFCGDTIAGTKEEILVWAHYGDSHRGVCLEFEFGGGQRNAISKVIYSDKPLFVNILRREGGSDFSKALAVKSSAWQYENEYRIIRGWGETHIGFLSQQLLSVTYGLNADAIVRRFIKGALVEGGYNGLTINRTKMMPTDFLLYRVKHETLKVKKRKK